MVVRMERQQSPSTGVGNRRFSRYIPLILFGGLALFGNYVTILYNSSDNNNNKSEAKHITEYGHTTIQHNLSPWEIAMQEAKELLNATNNDSNDLPSCLVPDKKKTLALVRDTLFSQNSTSNSNSLLPLPVMNMGMPKCGSTTLFQFFNCTGLRATHWRLGTTDFEGLCMRDAVSVGLPPIASCGPDVQAFMQFDVEYPFGTNGNIFGSKMTREECFFPQLSLLEELHAEDPNATFVMNFRPIDAWITSLSNWVPNPSKPSMLKRFQLCHFPNLPRGFPQNLTDRQEVIEIMSQFFCSHVQHLRNFVQQHPSHALIELDLYDTQGSSAIMEALFPSNDNCWGHENQSKEKKKKNKGSG